MKRLVAAIVPILLVLASCGGDSESAEGGTSSTTSTTEATTTTIDPAVEDAEDLMNETVELIEEFGRQWDYGTTSSMLLAGDRAIDSCDDLDEAMQQLPGYDSDDESTDVSLYCLMLSLDVAGIEAGEVMTNETADVVDGLKQAWNNYKASSARG